MVGRRALVFVVALGVFAVCAWAAVLEERTRRAFDAYAEEATRAFLERVRGGTASTTGRAAGTRELRDGELVAQPAGEDGIITVPAGLVHHWAGRTFIRDARLEDALRVSYAYEDYDTFYTPVIASRVISHDGDSYRAVLRIRESGGGLSAVLDVTTHIRYFYPDRVSVYSISTSEDIREVKDAGTRREQLLPAGRDSGYLWRAVTLNRLVERDGGVLVEMETLGLSRSFPPLLGWFIEPIARRLGRKSIETSLGEFRAAVRARLAR